MQLIRVRHVRDERKSKRVTSSHPVGLDLGPDQRKNRGKSKFDVFMIQSSKRLAQETESLGVMPEHSRAIVNTLCFVGYIAVDSSHLSDAMVDDGVLTEGSKQGSGLLWRKQHRTQMYDCLVRLADMLIVADYLQYSAVLEISRTDSTWAFTSAADSGGRL